MKMLLLDHLIPYSLKIGTTRLKSLLRKIPRTITRAGGDTFPSGLFYKPLFLVMALEGTIDIRIIMTRYKSVFFYTL